MTYLWDKANKVGFVAAVARGLRLLPAQCPRSAVEQPIGVIRLLRSDLAVMIEGQKVSTSIPFRPVLAPKGPAAADGL
jgi:hypothetical protein